MLFDVGQEMLRYCIWSGPHEEHKKKAIDEVVYKLFFFPGTNDLLTKQNLFNYLYDHSAFFFLFFIT